MSLHVGLIRLGRAQTPLVDVLTDTTDTDLSQTPFCHVAYNDQAARAVREIERKRGGR